MTTETSASRPGSGSAAALPLVQTLLDALTTSGRADTLKITVLSWDSRTCFRLVEALLSRFRPPPEDVESHPSFAIIHEQIELGAGHRLEVLGLRADAFQPEFAAPLVQNCHVVLVGADLDAGHVWGGERGLVERLNEVRKMLCSGIAAGRVTVGGGAVTDPGCDVVIPELARFLSWKALETREFLPSVLREAARRLGLEIDPPESDRPADS